MRAHTGHAKSGQEASEDAGKVSHNYEYSSVNLDNIIEINLVHIIVWEMFKLHFAMLDNLDTKTEQYVKIVESIHVIFQVAVEALENMRTVASLTKEPKFHQDYDNKIEIPHQYVSIQIRK